MTARRTAQLISLLAILLGGAGQLCAQNTATGEQPDFVFRSLIAQPNCQVERIASLSQADVVVLTGGYDAGFRPGVACNIQRGEEIIGTLVVAEATPEKSAALITELNPENPIRTGDTVRVRTFTFTR